MLAVDQPPGSGSLYPFLEPTPLSEWVYQVAYWPNAPRTPEFWQLEILPLASDWEVTLRADSLVVFQGLVSGATVQSWGPDREVVSWDYTVSQKQFLVLVVRPASWAAGSGKLVGRAIQFVPYRLEAVRIASAAHTGTISLHEGHNCTLEVQPQTDPLRQRHRVVIHGHPGAGAGTVNNCDELQRPLTRINGVATSNGRFQITADDCWRILPAVQTTTSGWVWSSPSSLRLLDDCTQCCPCDGYVHTYQAIRQIWLQTQALAQQAEAVRDQHHANQARIQSELACRASRPLVLISTSDKSRQLAISGRWCNRYNCCLGEVALRLSVQAYQGATPVSATITAGQWARFGSEALFIPAAPMGTAPVWQYRFTDMLPGSSVGLRVRLRVQPASVTRLRLWLSAHISPAALAALPASCGVTPTTPPPELVGIWSASSLASWPTLAFAQREGWLT